MAAMTQPVSPRPPARSTRWVTGIGAGLTAAGIGFAVIAPADFLGFVVLAGAAALTVGIGKGI